MPFRRTAGKQQGLSNIALSCERRLRVVARSASTRLALVSLNALFCRAFKAARFWPFGAVARVPPLALWERAPANDDGTPLE
jgi:hypothetical protein